MVVDCIFTSLWANMGSASDNPMGMHWAGMVFGLGLAVSFGYWCTDFLQVQRVMAAKDLRSAQNGTIIGAAFKMLVPLIRLQTALLCTAHRVLRAHEGVTLGLELHAVGDGATDLGHLVLMSGDRASKTAEAYFAHEGTPYTVSFVPIIDPLESEFMECKRADGES